jgi:acetate kinase
MERSLITQPDRQTSPLSSRTPNAAHHTRISTPPPRVGAFVIPTDEEIVIARAMRKLAL